jgi:hypothetical protein
MEVQMIVVRYIFQTEWGKAQETVDSFKEMAQQMKDMMGTDFAMRIYTDLSGPFHTVVQELEVESLAAWEEARKRMFSDPQMQEMDDGGESYLLSGSTELYTLEASF